MGEGVVRGYGRETKGGLKLRSAALPWKWRLKGERVYAHGKIRIGDLRRLAG